MFRFWRLKLTSWAGLPTTVGVFLALLVTVSRVDAAVTITADTGYDGPDRQVFTYDPYAPVGDPPMQLSIGERNVALSRSMRQTFKTSTTFNVGQIVLSAVTRDTSVGVALRFYEVSDVNAGSWAPSGPPIKSIVIPNPTIDPASMQNLSFALDGGDVFTLPARFEGTTGYGLEISTAFSNDTDGTFVSMKYYTSPPSDVYLDGRWYRETGDADGSRDVGLALFASNEVPCGAGDVDCDMDVDADDLAAIAGHFRQTGGRSFGDLTGNGFIDFDDFGEWKLNYTGPPLGASSFSFLSVPEPGCLALLIGGLLGGVFFNARRRTSQRRY